MTEINPKAYHRPELPLEYAMPCQYRQNDVVKLPTPLINLKFQFIIHKLRINKREPEPRSEFKIDCLLMWHETYFCKLNEKKTANL